MTAPDRRQGVRPAKSEKGKELHEVRVWEIDTAGARDKNGQPLPRRRWLVRGSQAKASSILATRIAGLQSGDLDNYSKESREPKTGGPVTLKTYAESHYLPWCKDVHSASTYVNRESDLRVHLLPKWGHLPLQKMQTTEVVREIHAYLQDPEQHQTRRGLKKNRARNAVLATLSAVLGHASSQETAPNGRPLISRVKIARLPEDEDETPTEDMDGFEGVGLLRQHRIHKEDMAALVTAAETSEAPELAVALVKLGSKCGLRAGEMAGLKWSDCNLDKGVLTVVRAVCPKTFKLQRTKTKRVATLPIEESTLKALHDLKNVSKSEFVLGTPEGYRTSRDLRGIYADLTLMAWGKTSRRLHRLRHTFASDLADSGMPPHKIKRLCRHKSVKTTYGYMHPGEGLFDEAKEALRATSGATSPREAGGGASPQIEELQAQILQLTQLISRLAPAAE